MNKKIKGFTLIELLAVIVIVAVLSIILIPLILNIIDNVKKSAAKSSADSYLATVELLFANNEINSVISSDGSYDAAVFVSNKMKGTFPSLGDVVIENNKLKSIDICINNYQFTYQDKNMVFKSDDCNELKGKPTYELSAGIEDLTANKTVSIYYPSLSVTRYFMVTSGVAKYQSSLVTNNTWVEVSNNSAEIIFLSSGTLTTKITDGKKDILGNTIVVGNIDSTNPIIDLSTLPTTINYDAQNINTVYSFNNYATFGKMGGTISCVSDLNPGVVLENTSKLGSGTNNLTCTANGNNGLSISANISINFIVKTDYTVSSIMSGVQTLEIPNGNYNFTVSTGTETIIYPIELINYYNNLTINTNTSFGDNTTTKKTLVVKFHKDLTINSGITVTATDVSSLTYKKGMFIYVYGTLTNDGTITMTGKGTYNQAGENVYLYKNNNDTYEVIPAIGGTGGAAVTRTAAQTAIKGTDGTTGTLRRTGGGGAGGAFLWVSGTSKSGAGSAGTAYSGGTGGGGIYISSGTITGVTGIANGGAGGAGTSRDGGVSKYYAGGGAGNLGANGSQSNGATTIYIGNYAAYKGNNGTGGLLSIYSNNLKNNGTITSNGAMGGFGQAAGGSSGGGSINIFYGETYSSTGSITTDGGASSTAGSAGIGGKGGTGSITIGSIKTGLFISN